MNNPLSPIETKDALGQIDKAMINEALMCQLQKPSKLNDAAMKAMGEYTRAMMGVPPKVDR